jgi:dipeptidyl aminopeptidase/acylaminoacyl peptidase
LASNYQFWVRELGLAVILPNVRGSTGYGRAYTLLDNGEKREDSVKDIGALLDWIATQPRFDARRVAVYGGSYGGYMVLASGAHFPDRIAAIVDVVGISNFVTFLESTKEYRRDLRRVEYGDERDPKMRAFLEQISPTNNAHKIKAPLFVVQGANDPRVPLTESEQMVAKIRGQGGAVWYMVAADEGHGFQKKDNRDAFLAATTLFWEKYLLGK